jgi:SulP family sulfate permease
MKISHGLNDIIAGVLSGIVIVIIATAFTALVFRGPLAIYFSTGITCAIIGSCIINFFIVSKSSFRFAIGRPEPAAGAILAIIFANIAALNLAPQFLLPTLIATIALLSITVGISLFTIGYFQLGQIARFLPFPVLGGIVTGTALIMVKASIILLMNNNFSFDYLSQPQNILQYSTGMGYAILLLFILKKNAHSSLLPISFLVAAILVNLFLHFNHVSHADAIQQGWMFNSFKPDNFLQFINFSTLEKIDWLAILYQTKYLISLIALVIILSLLNVSGLEAIVKGKADLDNELKISGLGNIVSGLLMGVTANISLSGTILNKRTGAENRLSGLIASLVCLIVLFISPELISYLPKPIIGGLLLYIGIKLLLDWLYEEWKILPTVDYLIVLAILLTVAFFGFVNGVLVGIIITCFVLVIRYARINSIKFSTTGINYHSNVIRPLYQQKWQSEQGDSIQIFKLQGYLFFGSAKLLVDHVTQLIESDKKNKLRFLIFDFHLVSGVDSSAIYNFIRLTQLIENKNIKILLANCSQKIIPQFKRQGMLDDTDRVMMFVDLDQAMEWCEDEILKLMPDHLRAKYPTIEATLNHLIPDAAQLKIFEKYLEKTEVTTDTALFKQGDAADCLYFIESGEVSIFIENHESVIRVSKSGAGTIVGEIGFYLGQHRTATVRTDANCIIYKLTNASLKKLEQEHPDIALIFHRNLVQVLASRVVQTNEMLMASQ